MPPGSVVTLNVGPASDGTGAVPNSGSVLTRNDGYLLERVAQDWATDQRINQRGISYRLDRLPNGYSGWQKIRGTSTHVDRYVYGHPNGPFDSAVKFFEHFKHLQDSGGSAGCTCFKCAGKKSHALGGNGSITGYTPKEQSRFFALPSRTTSSSRLRPSHGKQKIKASITYVNGLPQGRLPSVPLPANSYDSFYDRPAELNRLLIDKLKAAAGKSIELDVIDKMSPDWRAGNRGLQSLLAAWQALPSFVPRVGELVLFTRNSSAQGPDQDVSWEAGVITQMPVDEVSAADLTGITAGKMGVTNSGFRIEPISDPGSKSKLFNMQHKYVGLHAIRPFAFWKEYLSGGEDAWHPTIKHALAVTNSLCVIGKFSFKGVWPDSATLFARGVYLGAELIMVGDTVRILPMKLEASSVTDVMVVTAIRVRIVNLDPDREDQYNVCLHISGKTFTLDPKRSSGGIGKTPVTPGRDGLPQWMSGYGQWFAVHDPTVAASRIELPYTRIIGRWYEDSAVKSWVTTPSINKSSASFQAVSRNVTATKEARSYSLAHDGRINKAAGKSWFWAETRIEQLDLHEVNGKFVGAKDDTRTKSQMHAWRQALKVLDGMRGGQEEYHALRQQRKKEEQQRRESAHLPSSSRGMMASTVQIGSTSDAEMDVDASGDEDDSNGMEDDEEQVDEEEGDQEEVQATRRKVSDIIVVNSESGEEDDKDDLMME